MASKTVYKKGNYAIHRHSGELVQIVGITGLNSFAHKAAFITVKCLNTEDKYTIVKVRYTPKEFHKLYDASPAVQILYGIKI